MRFFVNALKIVVGVLVGLFLIGVVIGFVEGATEREPELKQASIDNTAKHAVRSAFVEGCAGEGVSRGGCECLYDSLDSMYPDFATNEARFERIIERGYTQAETDEMISRCQYEIDSI